MPAHRIMLLLTATTYRAQAFADAADRLGVELVVATDMPRQLAEFWHEPLGIDFGDIPAAVAAIADYAQTRPLAAILAVDDSGSLVAAAASAALGLPHNSPDAAFAARDKHRMRTLLAAAGVASPPSHLYSSSADLAQLARETTYPCVVKPRQLSGSRGVIRANDPAELIAAVTRLLRLLHTIDPHETEHTFLIEDFIPGFEVALEGLLDDGKLTVLALFDKPDPLDGPFFEETIYVTPSRLPAATQDAIARCAADAAAALGLHRGPMHAELRLNEAGPWIVEVAGRSIGGLCSKTLRFGPAISLEEVIVRQACGLSLDDLRPAGLAGGVMMIPIPTAGMLRTIDGLDAACATPLVNEVEITARPNYPLVPLPEGDSYLGFIFASGSTPAEVEAALRTAHRQLRFTVAPLIELLSG